MDRNTIAPVGYTEPVWAVFGDVHAHYKRLKDALLKLGVDVKAGFIPKNLTIVQVGDLLHRGPSTNETMELVDRLIKNSNHASDAGTWIQLMGNHESDYFDGCPYFVKMEASEKSIKLMRSWREEGNLQIAYAIAQDKSVPFVASHAGINPFWFNRGSEESSSDEVFDVVKSLNSMELSRICSPGVMLTGKLNHRAGPFWAESAREVYVQWEGAERVPFHQIHGHAVPYWWPRSSFFPNVPEFIRPAFVLDNRKRHSFWTSSDGMLFACIDPAWGKSADSDELHPLILDSQGIRNSILR